MGATAIEAIEGFALVCIWLASKGITRMYQSVLKINETEN